MKSIFKLIYMVAIVFLTCLFLISCKEIDKNISSIEISNLEEVSILKLNNFKYSDIELTVKYENGEDEIINLSSSMMTKEDALKFKQVGKHEVYIYYKDMSIKYNFEIIASSNDFDNVIFTLDETSFIYSGMPCKPNVIVSGKDLTLDDDYSVEYINNINAGTGVVIIKGINDYKGEKVLTFTIDKKTLIIKANNITISGNEKPVFTVSYNGFVYTDDENSLMGTLKITCEYDDSISGNYEINASGYTSNNYNIIYEKGVRIMWNRVELKTNAKGILKAKYWKAVLVAFIASALTGASSYTSAGGSNNDEIGDLFTSLSPQLIIAIVGIIAFSALIGIAISIFLENPLLIVCYKFFINFKKGGENLNDIVMTIKNGYMNVVLKPL